VPGQYASIQAAINAASPGDTIQVGPGTYHERLNIMKALEIVSTGGAAATVIDGDRLGDVVCFDQVPTSTLARFSGFTITDGGNAPAGRGGGVTINLVNGLTIENCIISANSANDGAGILITGHSVCTIQNNQITGNTAARWGAGICVSDQSPAAILNNQILNNNVSQYGGGILVAAQSSPTIQGNTISGNTALGEPFGPLAGPGGGGICVSNSSTPQILDNTITGNQASHAGGGIELLGGAVATISGNSIRTNQAPFGGGIHVETGANVTTISGNTISENVSVQDPDHAGSGCGAGISVFLYSQPVITGNTIANNTASLYGAGIVLSEESNSTISGNQISGNATSHDGVHFPYASGAGIYIGQATADVDDNTFSDNISMTGGGITVAGDAVLTLDGNTFDGNSAMEYGGGVFVSANTNVTLEYNTIRDNWAVKAGGGIHIDGGGTTAISLTGNTFAANSITSDGSQPYAYGGNINVAHVTTTFTNNVIRDGEALSAGGIYVGIDADVTLQNNTIVRNVGHTPGQSGGLWVDRMAAACLVRNNAFALNNYYQALEGVGFGEPSFVVWDSNFFADDGDGMFFNWNVGAVHTAQQMNDAPQIYASGTVSGESGFIDALLNDFGLRVISPMVDAGSPTGAPALDIERTPRSTVDIGAYEYSPPTANAGSYYDDDVGTIIGLSGAASSDSGVDLVLFEWDLDNDGQYDDATGVTANYNATTKGLFTIGLRITDEDDASDTATATVIVDNDTVALFDPTNAAYYLRNHNTAGPADWSFYYGAPSLGWLTTLGDWNSDSIDTVGLFDPVNAVYYLRNVNAPGNADIAFAYGLPGAGWLPVVGDWDANGSTTVGLFDPVGSVFYLRNDHAAGNADYAFPYGAPGAGWLSLVGDWDGDGDETVGLYDPAAAVFYLRNGHAGGPSDVAYSYGPPGSGWLPVVGDWNADGVDTVGLYDPTTSTFFLRNTHAAGAADRVFNYGPAGLGWKPAIGDWDDTGPGLRAAGGPGASEGVAALSGSDLQPIVAQAVADWLSVGVAVDLLDSIHVVVADLPGSQLGLATLDTIFIDLDAAGHGWFVDPTPEADEEFIPGAAGALRAIDPRAVDRIDLLTVVSHELGHAMGLEDADSASETLMGGILQTGVRRHPS
jgi:parallel beta-helix repeat protein